MNEVKTCGVGQQNGTSAVDQRSYLTVARITFAEWRSVFIFKRFKIIISNISIKTSRLIFRIKP